jgi:hypothetical protein
LRIIAPDVAEQKEKGGRPSRGDAASIMISYQSTFADFDVPAFVSQ